MNPLKRALAFLFTTAVVVCFAAQMRAQIVCYYDASGNPTNSFLSASTGLSTSVVSSNQTLTIGDQLSLGAMANGSGPFTYQWRLDGVNIVGATNAIFFDRSVTGTDAGAYSVVITGPLGSLTNVLGTLSVLATTNTLFATVYGQSRYFGVGAGGSIVSSSNLIAWTALSSATSNDLYGATFGNNTFVAVGSAGTVVTSTNGTDWVSRNSGNGHHLYSVTFGNSLFVAVGAGGTTLTSPDAINWTTQTFDNPSLESVVFGNSLFVALGTGGSIWTSSNGTNWVGCISPTTDDLTGVTYGNGVFVGVGEFGETVRSTDAVNWTLHYCDTFDTFSSILFFNNTFFAIGAIGDNFISTDGINWGTSDAGTFAQLWGSTVGNNIPIAVGEAGTVLRIPYSLVDHFTWGTISSPQRAGQSFSVTITAKDAANNTLTNFAGVVTLTAQTGQTSNNTNLIPNVTPTTTGTGTNTTGYAFTPNADLLVTAVRHYGVAKSISIWKEDQTLLTSVTVTSLTNGWVTTPLPVPLSLKAGTTYVVGAYSEASYYYRMDGSNTFADGTIDQGFSTGADEFPLVPTGTYWFLVDLSYTVQRGQTNTVSPTTATFSSGIANISPSVGNAGENVALTATDSFGNFGLSNPFNVYAANDLAVTAVASPSSATVQSNLTYTVTVMNSGPSAANSVNVTNVLAPSVSFVSATSSQGTCQYANGQVTCSVGTLSALGSATLTIVVTPTSAGVLLTNAVNVAQSGGSDPNPANNSATVTTYVPPTLSISDVINYEGNVGYTTNHLSIVLSSASTLAVHFAITTLDGTNANPAVAGQDYVPMSTQVTLPPGFISYSLDVLVQGNTIVEPTKQFLVRMSNPENATFSRNQATVFILNDDGLAGQVQNLVWSNVTSPQVTNQPFAATITATDGSGAAATSFSGSVALTGINTQTATNSILNGAGADSSTSVNISTVGFQFTPTNDIYVTAFRSYSGSKVSIWTDTGFLVTSQSVASVPGTWVDTALTTPVHLLANNTYRIGVFSGGNPYYWGNDNSVWFPDGEINGSFSSLGDTFPSTADSARWYLVDLRYTRAASITPMNSGSFTNGVWAGNIAIRELSTNIVLMADDMNGHVGFSSSLSVYQPNDLALACSVSPATPVVGTNITYTLAVMNPGPNTSTGVQVTNILPTGATFVSATCSQGTCSQSGGVVTASLGSIGNLSSATVTIVVTPSVAGLSLTDSATVTRNEVDPNPGNNAVTVVVIPNLALTLALSQATDYSLTAWRSGGNALWGVVTNITHDGIDAAQSGSVINNQETWMETTVRGPGTLSFWWKVSSQASGDRYYFLTNSVAVTNISGNLAWQQVNFSVAPGINVLRWDFVEDSSIHSGTNAAWLDQVSYSIPPFSFSSVTANTNGTIAFAVNGTNGQQLILQTSTNLVDWQPLVTNVISGGVINYTDSAATNFSSRFYRAVFQNP